MTFTNRILLFILFVIPTFLIAQCELVQLVNTPIVDSNLVLHAAHQITAEDAIEGNATVVFKAGNNIKRSPGFHVEQEVDFLAKIEACPDSLYELLGNMPQNAGINGKARNIWDLQLYQDKIYLGFGSTTQNTGPTPLWAFNPNTYSFENLCTIGTEAIERLRVWNDTLFVPNADPTSGDLSKFTYLVDTNCHNVSLSHKMAHVRDLYYYNGRYYLVGNTRCPGSKEYTCAGLIALDNFSGNFDNTLLQAELLRADSLNNSRWNWFFGLMEVDGELIIPNAMFTRAYHPNLTIKHNLFYQLNQADTVSWSAFQPAPKQLNHSHFYTVDTAQTAIVDTAGLYISLRIFEHQSFQTKTIYTLRTYSMFSEYYQTEYNNSAGMMLKDSLRGLAKKVNFSAANAVGEDLKIIDGQIYVLANEKIGPNQFKVYVYAASSPTAEASSWTEILQLDTNNMARSFEYDNNYFYFGLGYNQGDEIGEAGQLIRIKKEILTP